LTPVQRLQSLWSYRPRLVRFALGMGACSFVAEDIASEALVRAAFARTLAVEVGNPLPYLVAVAGNLMRDEFRRAAHDAALSRRTQVVPRQRDLENEVVDRDYAVRALRRLRDSGDAGPAGGGRPDLGRAGTRIRPDDERRPVQGVARAGAPACATS
jgi:DNA-directed RNA polymerase specialized sigma24 family protein